MKTLITGGSGVLGTELKKLFPNSLFPSHSELDITNHEMVFDYFSKNEFDLIIHTAAMTSVRQCESEKKLSWDTNVIGTKNLVDAAIKFNPDSKFSYVVLHVFLMVMLACIRKVQFHILKISMP